MNGIIPYGHGCNSYTFETLSEQVGNFENVDTLVTKLDHIDWSGLVR